MGTESVLPWSEEGKELTRFTTVLKRDTGPELTKFHSRWGKSKQCETGVSEVLV
jgi:hypothetical protein